MNQIFKKLEDRNADVSIIGQGYVGLPLAVAAAQAGYRVTGIDLDEEKIRCLSQGQSFNPDVPSDTIASLTEQKKLRFSSQFSSLAEADVVCICVPTPLDEQKNPDLSCVLGAAHEVKRFLRRGQLIVLESTVQPGATEEILRPLLEETGLRCGTDFYLAFSPERIDPGNRHFGLRNTPKIVGGTTPEATEAAKAFYGSFVERVVPVSSSQAAEMAKLLENTFRAVNIAFANEVSLMCRKLGIDAWEVIDAAATKPFGYMAFYPGPGVGGHCIPVDPLYLDQKLKSKNFESRFIKAADEINSERPAVVAHTVEEALKKQGKEIKGAKLLVLGLSYKKDVSDVRESPSVEVARQLMEMGAKVDYSDPHVPRFILNDRLLTSTPLNGNVKTYDAVVLLTPHSDFDLKTLAEEAALFIDTRNATKDMVEQAYKIVRL
ncbi:MAG: nucleotide sugar dehydrogenase [bacterium]